jgi:hypothetical protein
MLRVGSQETHIEHGGKSGGVSSFKQFVRKHAAYRETGRTEKTILLNDGIPEMRRQAGILPQ